MIIVSQDKKVIYNFDNISSIQIEECNGTYNLIVYDQINDRDSLGEYKSKERAREVLQEIIKIYEYCRNKDLKIYGYNTGNTYYMPQE